MSSYSTATTTAAAALDQGSTTTTITAIHPDILRTHILNRLDGPTLASICSGSKELNTLSSEDSLWMDICNSTWPSTVYQRVREVISSFPSGHQSLYSDAFPTVQHQLHHHNHRCRQQPIKKRHVDGTYGLISAVDIYYDNNVVYSKVIETETLSGWFLCSPFRIDLLDTKETIPTSEKFSGEEGTCLARAQDRLRVSWIVIDPAKKRAVNVASVKPVEARRHWLTEEIQLRYSMVVPSSEEAVQCGVVVTCGGKEGGEMHVREVSMQVEDMEGRILNGMDSLAILQAAMEGQRKKSDGSVERENYEMLLRMRIESRERKERRERNLDMVCMATGIFIFLAFWILILMR